MVKRTEKGILLPDTKPSNIPVSSQWLAGQGSGSWYHLDKKDKQDYIITRFSPEGEIEFKEKFKIKDNHEFCINGPYVFTYLSHCKSCKIIQHSEKIEFINVIH